jgi:hypothetical protein
MKTQKLMTALLYVGIFAGIPLAIIVALFFLPVLNSVDPTAIVILIIFTVLVVALWLFVPLEQPEPRRRKGPKDRRATVKRAVAAPIALEELTGEEKKPKARSRRPVFEESEKREPFVDVVEKSTRHPAAQQQVRRKAQSKARKKSTKKKKR